MKRLNLDKKWIPITIWGTFLLISTILLYSAGPYNFCYIEQWQTFIFDSSYINHIGATPGGIANLIAHFLIQFFRFPITGILITALLLSVIFILNVQIFRQWTNTDYHLVPLALMPTISLALLHFNTNYLYAGSIAFVLMMFSIFLQNRITHFRFRFVFSFITCILLFFMAGPIAMLYSMLLLIMEGSRSVKKAGIYLLYPLLVILLGYYSLRMGWTGEWKLIIGPDGYFTHRLPAGSIVYLPWGMTICTFIIAYLFRRFRPQKHSAVRTAILLQVLVASAFLYLGSKQYVSKDNEFFKELNYLARNNRWEDIIKRYQEQGRSNVLYHNYLNLALAEQGKLSTDRKAYPAGTQSLFLAGNKTPYISAMLSDIYFSMGHISFAQRYAFEANESSGNFSPKLLQRLVQTSLIYGNDELAQKYIQLLEKTLFYKDWATQHRKYLNSLQRLAEDATLSNLKRCIFPDNRFAGSKGLDDDLKQILDQNPGHKPAKQYLNAIQAIIGTINQ